MLTLLLLAFFILIILNAPMFFCLLLPSTLYLLIQDRYPLSFIIQRMVDAADSYPLLAIPLFILAANIMNQGGVTMRIYQFAKCLAGHIPGGLAHVNVVASIFFAGITGSAVAEAGGLGKIEIEAMVKNKFDPAFSAAVAGSSAIIGPIIPPSIPLVIYGSVAEVSVGALFIAGIIPGLLMGLSLMIMIYIISKKRDYPKDPRAKFREITKTFFYAFPALLAPVIIVGGILGGIFTPTEAAMVAVFYAGLLGIIETRTFRTKDYLAALLDSSVQTGVIMLILVAAVLFGTLLAHENASDYLMKLLAPFTHSQWQTLLIMNILLLIIGCIMEPIISLLIFLPMLLPVAINVGVHPIHFGLMAVLNLMIGLLTPPVGMVLYVMTSIVNLPFERVAKATSIFLIPLIIVLFLITYIPDLVMFLPKMFLPASTK